MDNEEFKMELKIIIEETSRLFDLSNQANISYKSLLNYLTKIDSISDLITESNRIKHFIVDSYDGDTELSDRLMQLLFKYATSK